MKTPSLETLRRRASSATKSRGHSMQWRDPFGRAGGPLSQFGKCRYCGKEVLIAQSPAPNGIDIEGEAVALDCIRKTPPPAVPDVSPTPAPWRVGMAPGPIIYGPNGEQIADMRADLLTRSERSANLRLIAAAPDLLAALEAAAELLCELQGFVSSDQSGAAGCAIESARTAIAKATGRHA